MKNKYPDYKIGELQTIYKSMPKKDQEAIEEFLIKCGITIKTKPKLEKVKRILIQFYDVTELSLLKQDKTSVNTFLFLLNESNRSVWTKNEIKVYLKQFLKRIYKDLEMIEDIKSDNKRGLNPEKITEGNLINDKDVERMLRFANNHKEKAYLLLSFTTGARPTELINLKFSDITFEKDYADVSLFSPKTKASRTYPVVDETMKALWELREHYPFPGVTPQDYVFSTRTRGKPMTSNGINKMLRRLASSAGINKDIWGYLLRHSRATKLYEELPTPIVEKLMGHHDQYRVYAHISSKKAREELLKKVYHVEELTPQEKEKITNLTSEMEELRNKFLKEELERKELQEKIELMIKEDKAHKEKIVKFFELMGDRDLTPEEEKNGLDLKSLSL